MRNLIRFVLRVAAVLLVAGAVYLVLWAPSATVVTSALVTKVNVSVQCSSLWDQWTNHAHPAALTLNSKPLVTLQAAQQACQSGSTKLRAATGGLAVGAIVALVVSFLSRPRRPAT